jgi:hypothetical protein
MKLCGVFLEDDKAHRIPVLKDLGEAKYVCVEGYRSIDARDREGRCGSTKPDAVQLLNERLHEVLQLDEAVTEHEAVPDARCVFRKRSGVRKNEASL